MTFPRAERDLLTALASSKRVPLCPSLVNFFSISSECSYHVQLSGPHAAKKQDIGDTHLLKTMLLARYQALKRA